MINNEKDEVTDRETALTGWLIGAIKQRQIDGDFIFGDYERDDPEEFDDD